METYYDRFLEMEKTMNTSFSQRLVAFTEKRLTMRKAKNRITDEKNKKKGPLREWIEAILWAVVIVFLINQFIFQLYQIPTSSMESTLLIKDRVFVNKALFGPELYPGGPTAFDYIDPDRDDIIIFENPNYISRGPVFDVLNRVIYMITFSLVNIDKDEDGNPRAQLYVKRLLGYPKDTISFDKGEVMIQPSGYEYPVTEASFRDSAALNDYRQRLFSPEDYESFTAYSQLQAYAKEGIQAPIGIEDTYKKNDLGLTDYYHTYLEFYRTRTLLAPQDLSVRSEYTRYHNGFYIPDGYMLPIGDNRDNSGDGRYFGPVAIDEVLGKASFRFWPLPRWGILD